MARRVVRVSGHSWKTRPTSELYRLTLGAFEAALAAADPRLLVRKSLRREGDLLFVRGRKVDLGRFERIFVLGGGKATGGMAAEAESILGDRVTDGAVIVPDYTPVPSLKRVAAHPSTHPFPSPMGARGVRSMLGIADRVTDRDLCICLFSGGGSALMPFPADGIELADKVATTKLLLRSGADIGEMNVVRKHLSAFKGGRLAERLLGATVLSLVISDVPGDRFDTVSSGPTAPDPTTFAEAHAVLRKYGIWSSVPEGVRGLISMGESGEVSDTPKPGSPVFAKVRNVIIGSNRDARLAAHAYLLKAGVSVKLRQGFYQGEASALGKAFSRNLLRTRPQVGSLASGFVAGGEATVRVKGDGLGGRDQELVLSASRFLSGRLRTIAALATDGVDGPSGAAGAIADSSTLQRGRAIGLSPKGALDNNDSHTYFEKLGDLLKCSPTGTNVNDVVVGLAVNESRPRSSDPRQN